MPYNKLLERQIKKYLNGDSLTLENIAPFIQAVNDSYNAFEKDLSLSAHAFKISEQEYEQINIALRSEMINRKMGVRNLREAIRSMDESGWVDAIIGDEDNLLDALGYLKNQITREKYYQKELERLSLVASANENGVAFCDPQGIISWANEGFSRLTGYSVDEIIGKTPVGICKGPLSDRNVLRGMVDDFMNARNFSVEVIHYRKDGSWFWGRARGQAILDGAGKAVQFFAMVEDITREMETQRKLNEAENRFKMAFEIIGDNLWEHDFETNVTTSSNRESRFLGYSNSEISSNVDLWWKSIIKEDLHLLTESDEKYRSGEIDRHKLEYRLLHKDGRIRWVLDRGVVIERKPDGSVLKIMGTHTDITHLKETELELGQRVRQFQALSENIPGVIFEYEYKKDGTEHLRYVSPAIGKIFGIKPDGGYNILDYLHPDDIEGIKEKSRVARETLQPYNDESRLVIPERGIIWRSVSMSFSYLTQDGSKVFTGFMLDTTERKNAEVALRKNEEKYRNITANMKLGLLEVNNDEIIIFANQAFCNMSGYSSVELMGKRAPRLLASGESENILKRKKELRRHGISDAYEVTVNTKSGETKWWLISGAPRYNDEGELLGSISIHLDITEQKQLEKDLTEARKHAEESSNAKEAFLANMSHEIRTPMNAIIGMGRQLKKTGLNEKQKLYLETINAAAENLLVVINDILDISKIEAGKLTIEKIGFSLREVLARIHSVMLHKAEEKGLKLSYSPGGEIPPVLLGDPYRLNQVLLNLVSNAVKFTEKGSVRITCSCVRQGEIAVVYISVRDTGIGMDKEFMGNLFQKFLQEDKTVARKYGGTGLGMSISKQLVELMSGNILVHSEKGEGTEITIHIPFEVGESKDIVEKEDVVADPRILKNKRILLVEDNEMNRLLANTVLNNYGALVYEAVNGEEAVEMLKAGKYDLVLMDVQMPVMDGLEATRVIRRKVDKSIPIIALTANAIKGEVGRCLEAGMNDYISKPFEEDDLIKMIAGMLGKEVSLVTPGKREENKNLPLYSLDKLKQAGRGNEAFVQKMLALFITQMPAAVEEIKAAFAAQDFPKVKATAHRISPILDNLDIVSLKAEIRQIESLALEGRQSVELNNLIDHLDETISKVTVEIKCLVAEP